MNPEIVIKKKTELVLQYYDKEGKKNGEKKEKLGGGERIRKKG